MKKRSLGSSFSVVRGAAMRRKAVIAVVLLAVAAGALGVCVLTDSAPATTQASAPIWIDPSSSTLTGHDITVGGAIQSDADLGGTTVQILKREVGENVDTLVTEVAVTHSPLGANSFQATIPAVTRSCIITATWEGNADYAAATTWMFARVRAKVALTVRWATHKSARFRIDVSPKQPYYAQPLTRPPFIAEVQWRDRGVWKRFPAELGSCGTDGSSWCTYDYYDLEPGTYYVRARFIGTNANVAGVSRVQRIVVR